MTLVWSMANTFFQTSLCRSVLFCSGLPIPSTSFAPMHVYKHAHTITHSHTDANAYTYTHYSPNWSASILNLVLLLSSNIDIKYIVDLMVTFFDVGFSLWCDDDGWRERLCYGGFAAMAVIVVSCGKNIDEYHALDSNQRGPSQSFLHSKSESD